jgi:hypothetical protein
MHAIAPSCLLPLPDLRSPQIAHQCLVAQQQSLDTLTAERQELDEHLSNIEPPTLVVFFNTRYLLWNNHCLFQLRGGRRPPHLESVLLDSESK